MQITETHGGIPVNMEVEWGHAVNPSAVREFLKKNLYILLLLCIMKSPVQPTPLKNWARY